MPHCTCPNPPANKVLGQTFCIGQLQMHLTAYAYHCRRLQQEICRKRLLRPQRKSCRHGLQRDIVMHPRGMLCATVDLTAYVELLSQASCSCLTCCAQVYVLSGGMSPQPPLQTGVNAVRRQSMQCDGRPKYTDAAKRCKYINLQKAQMSCGSSHVCRVRQIGMKQNASSLTMSHRFLSRDD